MSETDANWPLNIVTFGACRMLARESPWPAWRTKNTSMSLKMANPKLPSELGSIPPNVGDDDPKLPCVSLISRSPVGPPVDQPIDKLLLLSSNSALWAVGAEP